MRKVLTSISALFIAVLSFAQAPNQFELLLKNNQVQLEPNLDQLRSRPLYDSNELVNDRYYRLVQFYEMPSKEQKNKIKALDIVLLEYVPNKSYLASIPKSITFNQLQNLGLRALSPIKSEWKLEEKVALRNFDDYAITKDQVRLTLSFFKDVSKDLIQKELRSQGASILYMSRHSSMVSILVDPGKIDVLKDLPFVSYIEQARPPGTPEDNGGRGLHRNSMIDADYPTGRHYDGVGVNIMVRDDGVVGPHIDFKGRLNQENASTGSGSHGDGVAGVAGAAGNLNPVMRGAATGAFFYIRDYEYLNDEAIISSEEDIIDLHLSDNVVIANASYSDGCNDGYTSRTKRMDQQTFENPNFLHVFSAGNSNNLDCDYGAGDQWGNITGGHKQAKNVIATANLTVDAGLVNSSSRGPAHDGRIKPDLAAHGAEQQSTFQDNIYDAFGGTSAAAPCVMGTSAQLYQAYREIHGGEEPESGLIKATLLNTANDLGNDGPDFRFGWGHLNAYRAVLLLEDERHLSDSVDQGEVVSHTIDVPANTKQVRYMLYWTDKEATEMVNKALVNDLNLTVTTPNSTELLPWLLNSTPNAASLSAPATNGVDNLNNVEQVLINNPEEGSYEINVEGFEIPFDAVKYYIVYEIIPENDITVVYPSGGQAFVPGEFEFVHWDAIGDESTFLLEYSLDEGASWNTIVDGLPGTSRLSQWQVPDALTGRAMLRVSREGVSDTSDAAFSIGGVPQNLDFDEICYDQVVFKWDAVENATGYEVFQLGDRYMESIGTTTELQMVIPVTDYEQDNWYSVRALGDENYSGRRAIAVGTTEESISCVRDDDLGITGVQNPYNGNFFICPIGEDIQVQITIRNNGLVDIDSFEVSYEFNGAPPVIETITETLIAQEEISYTFQAPIDGSVVTNDTYALIAKVNYDLDTIFQNDSRRVEFTINEIGQAPLVEDFQQADFPPVGWEVLNPDEGIGWQRFELDNGPNGTSTSAAYINNYSYQDQGQEDVLSSFLMDLDGVTSPILSFDYAYAPFSEAFSDALRIEVYTNCGQDLSAVIFEKSGLDLSTTGDYEMPLFVPFSANDWKNEAIDLSSFNGEKVRINFVNSTGWGNSLFLDNINILNYAEPPTAQMNVVESTCVFEVVTVSNASDGFGNSYEWDFGDGASMQSATGNGPFNILYQTAGLKTISLIATNENGSDTLYQDVLVKETPNPSFSSMISNGEVSFVNESMHCDAYFWEFGDGETSTLENPTHTYVWNQIYIAKLTCFSENCDEKITSRSVEITTNTSEIELISDFKILPNPNKGDFQIQLINMDQQEAEIALLNIQGKRINTWTFNSINGQSTIEINEQLAPGVYVIQLQTANNRVVKKVTVQ